MDNEILVDIGSSVTKVVINGDMRLEIPTVVGQYVDNDYVKRVFGDDIEKLQRLPSLKLFHPMRNGKIADFLMMEYFIDHFKKIIIANLPLVNKFLPKHFTFYFHDMTKMEENFWSGTFKRCKIRYCTIKRHCEMFVLDHNEFLINVGGGAELYE